MLLWSKSPPAINYTRFSYPDYDRAFEQFLRSLDESQQVARAYEAVCTPDFFLFDRDRRLVYRGQFDRSGPGNDIAVTGANLRAACEALLSGKSVSREQTPSVGCSIKWKAGNEPEWA